METTEEDYDDSDIFCSPPVASNMSQSTEQNLRPGRNGSDSESNDIELMVKDTVAQFPSGNLSRCVLFTILTIKCDTFVAALKFRIVNPKIVATAENQKKKCGRPPKNTKNKEKDEEHASTVKESSEQVSDVESGNQNQNQPQKKKRKSEKVSYCIVLFYYCQYFSSNIG